MLCSDKPPLRGPDELHSLTSNYWRSGWHGFASRDLSSVFMTVCDNDTSDFPQFLSAITLSPCADRRRCHY